MAYQASLSSVGLLARCLVRAHVSRAMTAISSRGYHAPTEGFVHGDAIALNTVGPNPGAHQNSKRLGRGIGSTKGKTCGRGHKGQKSRSGTGKPRPFFEGGQTPLHMRMPKLGFKNRRRDELQKVNLDKIQYWIDSGRLPLGRVLTMRDLMVAGVVGKVKHGVKVLGTGAEFLKSPVKLEVTHVSESAREAIEKAGGEVHILEKGRREIMLMIKGANREKKLRQQGRMDELLAERSDAPQDL